MWRLFVKAREVGNRKFHHFICIERIESKLIFTFCNDDCEAQRVKAGLQQLQIIRQRHERVLLLPCYMLEYRCDRGPYKHCHVLRYSLCLYYAGCTAASSVIARDQPSLAVGGPYWRFVMLHIDPLEPLQCLAGCVEKNFEFRTLNIHLQEID